MIKTARLMKELAFKDKLILFGLSIAMAIAIVLSFALPLFYTLVAVNFFLLFVMMLFLLLYLEKGYEGEAITAKSFPSISIIVPVYNSIKTIGKCIDSLKKIDYPKKVEIIVVDDGSIDGSLDYLEKISGIKLLKLKQNSGKAIALNAGLDLAKTDLIACIDSDTYPETDVFKKTVGFFEDKTVGAVTCLILPDKNQSLVQKIQFFEYATGFGLWTAILSSINSMTMIPGPMTLFRKSAFGKIGGYEEGNLTEDMEMGLRLQKFGYKIKTCFEAKAYTDVPDTWKKLFRQRDRWFRGRVFNLMKYKNLFFNAKNTDLGFFALPYLFALELVSVALLLRLAILFANNAFKFFAIEATTISFANSIGLTIQEIIVSSTMFFLAFSYFLIFLFIYFSLRIIHYKPTPKEIMAIILNILLYPLFISVVYGQSFFKEMLGVKTVWARAST